LVNKKPVTVLYGGSFDPPHIGHQKIVDYLVSMDDVDTVVVTPAYLNPFKTSSMASPRQRLGWCRMVFADPKVIIDSSEVESGHSVYTVDTFRRLSDKYAVLYIAIGSDNLISIEKWHEFEILNDNVVWLVFGRSGYDTGYDKLREYRHIAFDEPASSSHIRQIKRGNDVDEKILDEVEKLLQKEENE
jgi:nicotinate-nucleotide adenylyltransferase